MGRFEVPRVRPNWLNQTLRAELWLTLLRSCLRGAQEEGLGGRGGFWPQWLLGKSYQELQFACHSLAII